MLSFARSTADARGLVQGETSRTKEIHPYKVPRREDISYGLSGNLEAGPEAERLVGTLIPSKPSLWNNSTFNTMAFACHLFSFLRKFPDYYHMLPSMSLSQLSTFMEVHLVRCFLVGKTLREKCSNTLKRM
ncbi:unnamed protein product [Vicia faba]|uniref:Uncharacterized protein n=1 Tax=Vicia faba TaxID=3906 RepID=A0AAV1B1T2_VICFA|nr:unnamed protein product [Vicia faba]